MANPNDTVALATRLLAEGERLRCVPTNPSAIIRSHPICKFCRGWLPDGEREDAECPVLLRAAVDALEAERKKPPLQDLVQPWLMACFGPEIANDKIERNHRFLEEALELVQACGCTQSEAHQLVDYVYGRSVGNPLQEVGGVMVTLAALCLANGFDMHEAGETELARIWTKIETIRAKQAAKPKHSPLPVAPVCDCLHDDWSCQSCPVCQQVDSAVVVATTAQEDEG